MKWLRLTFIVSLAILFVGSSFIVIFGGGKLLGQVFKTYAFKYETCEYKPRPVYIQEPPTEAQEQELSEKECFVDYNQAKKDIAEGLAMLVVSLPVTYLTQRQLRKEIKEVEK